MSFSSFCLQPAYIIIFEMSFCKQYVVRSCFLIHPANLYLLIGVFGQITINVIIGILELKFAILKIFIYLAALGLSCGMRDRCCSMWDLSLWHVGFSLLVVCGLQSLWAQQPHSIWDLSSPTRDRTCILCIGKWILNHWTTKEVPVCYFFIFDFLFFLSVICICFLFYAFLWVI